MNFDERYKGLNTQQKKAVDTIDGPLLVIAGPGSGKTEILSLRIGKILTESQILASNILCLTFTDSASSNMRNRLAGLIGSEAYHVAIHTFHSFCVEIIQKYPEYFYGGAFFSSADSLKQIEIMQEIFEKLPQKNSLRSIHPEQGFVYLGDSLKVIGYLKKAGIAPEEFKRILKSNDELLPEINEILQEVFTERISKETFLKATTALKKLSVLAEKSRKDFPSSYFNTIVLSTFNSLKKAVDGSKETENNKILTEWKSKWMKKDDNGQNVFRDLKNTEKLSALADIYSKYRETMHTEGYYDFDDMILDCLHVLEKNPSLRYEIQEQYQYVLVDEFQDTNDAQMRLLRLISDAPVHEGKPNIMAVGDDDQAVYKFQGAELSNILNFKNIFNDVEIVTMTDNYRSTQDILDIASHIIKKGEERLEKILPNIKKILKASNEKIKNGEIKHKEFQTIAHEYHFVSREIKKKIDSGENPEEIAVIARKHRQLESLVPYLKGAGIENIRYEREQNVLKEPHVSQIITISRFLISLADKHHDEADEYLPEILSFPFWKLAREDVWKISINSRKGEFTKNWLETMQDSSDKKIGEIAKFLIDLGIRAESEPLEKVLDDIIGAHVEMSAENEEDDIEDDLPKTRSGYASPFKEFYFSREKFENSRAEYLSFLSSLRVFVNALREYKSGEILSLKDLVEFVDLHEKNNISLNDQSPFAKLGGAINLLTAHKAKGLEFETVFVLSCEDDIWAGRKISSKITLPGNLPIEPAGDTDDDQLRLFYVAITRAKRHLYLTAYNTEEDGKEAKKLRFMVSEADKDSMESKAIKKLYFADITDKNEVVPEQHEVLTSSWLNYRTTKFQGSEKKLLETLLHEYQMPVTHLNNFLNISKGGPQYFLEQNLLRFPQSKMLSGSYGSAIHNTLERFILYLKKEGKLPKNSEVLDWFSLFLKKEKMPPFDFTQYEEKGKEALIAFLKEKMDSFKATDLVEFNFKEQGIFVSGAHLSGKIDRMVGTDSNIIEVHDYKTGKPPKNEWVGIDDKEKAKLYNYERQLIFYKILVENSREFGGKKKVEKGVLEFVEPRSSDKKIVTLDLLIDKEKTERLEKLISIVYKKIMDLDFPDVSNYPKDLKGIKDFEEDLLEGKV